MPRFSARSAAAKTVSSDGRPDEECRPPVPFPQCIIVDALSGRVLLIREDGIVQMDVHALTQRTGRAESLWQLDGAQRAHRTASVRGWIDDKCCGFCR